MKFKIFMIGLTIKITFIILNVVSLVKSITWDIGWYLDGTTWSKWDDSWKSWIDGSSWKTCEEFIDLFNQNLKLY